MEKNRTTSEILSRRITAKNIEVCVGPQNYIFGGYVRDKILHDSGNGVAIDFNDMDIFFSSFNQFVSFEKKLNNLGYKLVQIEGAGFYKREVCAHQKYQVTNSDYVELDIVIDAVINKHPEKKLATPVEFSNLDADVNSLKIESGFYKTMFPTLLDENEKVVDSYFSEIKKRILKKQYIPQPGMRSARIDKLFESGFVSSTKKVEDMDMLFEDSKAKLTESEKAALDKEIDKKISAIIAEDLKRKALIGEESVKEKKKKVGNTKMANVSLMDLLKSDGEDAAYRVAGTQMTNGTKLALLKLLEKQGHSSESLKAISELLETEAGNAAIAFALGMLLHYLPQINTDLRVQKLSKEFRVHGMSTAGNAVAGLLTESLLPVILESLNTLPQPSQSAQLRVATPAIAAEGSVEEFEEEDLDPTVSIKKKMVK